MVAQTCDKIMETSGVFRAETIKKIRDFVKPEETTSSRTSDVVKSIKVLAAQYISLLKVKDLIDEEEDKVILNPSFRKDFVRLAFEELCRRSIGSWKDLKEDKLLPLLMPECEAFCSRVFEVREKEINALYEVKPG